LALGAIILFFEQSKSMLAIGFGFIEHLIRGYLSAANNDRD